MAKKLPKSLRKYIRFEKARIRREVLDLKKQEEMIAEIYSQFFTKNNSSKTKVKKANQGEETSSLLRPFADARVNEK